MSINKSVSRRYFLSKVSAAAGALALPRWRRAAGAGRSTAQDLTALTAVEAIDAMGRGDITAESYARALLRQCEKGAALNAFITLRPEQVLEAARECDRERLAGKLRGPLHGLPIPKIGRA